jgi:hypothetical protein
MRFLFVLLLAGTIHAPAQSRGESTAARWTGRWSDVTQTQGGTLTLSINSHGMMTGTISNGQLQGAWAGQMRPDNAVIATYLYPGQFPAIAQGVWWVNTNGQVVARVTFSFQGQQLGEGDLLLAQDASINSAPGFGAPQVPGQQPANLLAVYPNGILSYLNSVPAGQAYLQTYGLPNINSYRNHPAGYLEALVPGYGSAVSGALEDIRRHGQTGAAPSPTSNIRNTISMISAMMRDASTLSPAEVQRKYGSLNALAGGIAAQNKIYNDYYSNLLDRQYQRDLSETRRADMEAERREWKAAWDLWQGQMSGWRATVR